MLLTIMGYAFSLALGWAVGALINYFGDVLPWKRRLTPPFCARCQAGVSWQNYLLWPRRCPSCGQGRGWRAWLVEGLAMAAVVGLWASPPARLGFWVGVILLVYFGVIVLIDMEHRLILHPTSLFGVALGLGVGIWLHGPRDTLLGGAVGFGSMWLLYTFGEWLLRLVARRRGEAVDEVALGFGDVNLSGVLGLLLGWPLIGVGLFLAILIGGAVSLLYVVAMVSLRRYHLFMALPYGPFLVAGAALLLYLPELMRPLFY